MSSPLPPIQDALAELRRSQQPSAAEALAALRGPFGDVSGGSSSVAEDRPLRGLQIPSESTGTAATTPQLTEDQSLRIQRSDAGILPTLLHGATFGASDEALGGIRAGLGAVGLGPETSYADARDDERRKLDDFAQDHPLGRYVAEGVGGLATGNTLLKGANALLRGGLGTGSALAQLTKAGAVAGGVSGFANADPEDGSLLDRAKGGAIGAGTGAATGLVTGYVGNLLFGPRKDPVDDYLIRAMGRDNETPASLLQTRQSLPPLTGDPETMIELSGPAMRRAARGVEALPGRGSSTLQNFAKDRATVAPADAIADLEKFVGSNSEDTYQLVDDLVQARSEGAKPLYDTFRAVKPIPVSDNLRRILSGPAGKQAVKNAMNIAAEERAAGIGPGLTGEILPDAPAMDATTLDYIKKGLDDVVKGRMGSEGGLAGNSLRASSATTKALVKEIDDALVARGDVGPDGRSLYKVARDQFGSESEVIEAIELGRQAVGKHPGQIRQMRRALGSAAAKEGFERGWLQGATDEIGKTTATGQLGAKLNKSGYHRDAVSAALGDDAPRVEQIQQMLARRSGVAETNNMFRGSRTAPTAEDVADLTGGSRAGSAAQQIGNRGFLGAARQKVMQSLNQKLSGLDEDLAGQAADRMIQQGPALTDQLQRMDAYVNKRGVPAAKLRTPATSAGQRHRWTPEGEDE